ncbi:hypothetical protein [Nitrosomonas sp. Nm84]|uniref:hypothetical protein n=1 Tax=Nitrosomonas sp. Nm84 TaxID=200124 RepID=UPI001047E88D|nr:hypothetical protein [Nitrosomonas sp. Nm84]
MRYGSIKSLRQSHSVALMCRVFNVSESSFYAQRTRPLCNRMVNLMSMRLNNEDAGRFGR